MSESEFLSVDPNVCFLLYPHHPCSYDSEGRLTNVTFPTGVVTSLHGDMSSGAVAVDIETSGRDEDVAITTNLSSIDSFYTLVQGKKLMQPETLYFTGGLVCVKHTKSFSPS